MALDVAHIREQRPGQTIHYFEAIDTTMREAARLCEQGSPGGTVVLANEQTAGMGRLGRTWHSEPDSGVYMSVLLRLPMKPAQAPIVTLLLGLAAAEAIERVGGVRCDLRWPNDVLVSERKVAGILAQAIPSCIIAGIGINVNQTSFPAEMRTPATSIRLERGGAPQSREDLVVCVLQSLDALTDLLATGGPEQVLRTFTAASSYARHRRIVIEDTGERGTTAGLDENGFLLVDLDSGRRERIAAGGIRPEYGAR